MDSGADNDSSRARGAKSQGDERAHGRKDDCSIQLCGRRLIGIACPRRSPLAGEALGIGIAGPCKGKDLPALMHGDLTDNVRRGAKAVESERFRRTGGDERTVADQTGAHQGSQAGIGLCAGQWEHVARIGNRVIGVASIDLKTGEPGVWA